MGNVPTIRVNFGESYAVINEADFDPAVHVRWGEKPPAPPADGGELPEGYEAKHIGRGKYKAMVNGVALPDGNPDKPGDLLFESKDEALAALRKHAEEQQAQTDAEQQ